MLLSHAPASRLILYSIPIYLPTYAAFLQINFYNTDPRFSKEIPNILCKCKVVSPVQSSRVESSSQIISRSICFLEASILASRSVRASVGKLNQTFFSKNSCFQIVHPQEMASPLSVSLVDMV